MPKYIAISDVHLGQTGADRKGQYSLLSKHAPRSKVDVFSRTVRDFAAGETLTLIVVGDFLDLSLAFLHDALTDFRDLLEATPAVKNLVWVAGNHDHHMWTRHCEDVRVDRALKEGAIPPPGGVYRPTSSKGEPFGLLAPLAKTVGCSVQIAYPSYSLVSPNANLDGDEQHYFSHGHLFGGLYTALSDILESELLGFDYERVAATVNAPLIESIYWLLGEAGEGMGADGLMEGVYADLQRGDTAIARKVIEQAVESLIPDGLVTGIPDSLEKKALVAGLMSLLRQAVPQKTAQSSDRHQPSDTTRRNLRRWITRTGFLTSGNYRRRHVIYGHTHVADMQPIHSTNITAWNLGSWLVEPNHEDPDTQLLMIAAEDGDVKTTWQKV